MFFVFVNNAVVTAGAARIAGIIHAYVNSLRMRHHRRILEYAHLELFHARIFERTFDARVETHQIDIDRRLAAQKVFDRVVGLERREVGRHKGGHQTGQIFDHVLKFGMRGADLSVLHQFRKAYFIDDVAVFGIVEFVLFIEKPGSLQLLVVQIIPGLRADQLFHVAEILVGIDAVQPTELPRPETRVIAADRQRDHAALLQNFARGDQIVPVPFGNALAHGLFHAQFLEDLLIVKPCGNDLFGVQAVYLPLRRRFGVRYLFHQRFPDRVLRVGIGAVQILRKIDEFALIEKGRRAVVDDNIRSGRSYRELVGQPGVVSAALFLIKFDLHVFALFAVFLRDMFPDGLFHAEIPGEHQRALACAALIGTADQRKQETHGKRHGKRFQNSCESPLHDSS